MTKKKVRRQCLRVRLWEDDVCVCACGELVDEGEGKLAEAANLRVSKLPTRQPYLYVTSDYWIAYGSNGCTVSR
jgi:hypothetical protein